MLLRQQDHRRTPRTVAAKLRTTASWAMWWRSIGELPSRLLTASPDAWWAALHHRLNAALKGTRHFFPRARS